MAEAPLISLIIPTYNSENTLRQCLNSIVQQSYNDYEIIIVDGLSTDATTEIIKDFESSKISIKWISEKDRGIFDAMNKGIKMAKGEWIYFLGSDDWLFDANVLSKFEAHIKKGLDIIYGTSVWMPEQKLETGEWVYNKLLNQSINHQRIFYKRFLFEKMGSFNIVYASTADYELNIRFFCNTSVRHKYYDFPVAYYNSSGFSAGKIDEVFWNNWRNILLKNFAPYLPKKKIYGRISWYCWYNIQKKDYAKAFNLFCNIYLHTFSFSFVKHSLSQLKKTIINKD